MKREPGALAWVHEDSGSVLCAPGAKKPEPASSAKRGGKVRAVDMSPRGIEHTAEVFKACCAADQAPGYILRDYILAMLAELKRLKYP